MTSQNAEELVKQGNALFVDEFFREALELYSRAVQADATNVDALVKRSHCQHKLKDFANSLADAERALALDAKHEMALLRRGVALHELGRFAEAQTALEAGNAVAQGNNPQFPTWLRKNAVQLATHSSTNNSNGNNDATVAAAAVATAPLQTTSNAPSAENAIASVTSNVAPQATVEKPRVRCTI